MRVALGAREFARLENFCAVANGKHQVGGVQTRRARWKAQLDARRSWVSGGPVPAEDRWLELTDDDVAFIRKFRAEPKKGGWQRAIIGDIRRCRGLSARVERIGGAELWLGDCREILPGLSGVDAVVTDPPYGISYQSQRGADRRLMKGTRTIRHAWDKIVGDDEPFDPSSWLHFPKVVLFGANHYAHLLPASAAWIIWDKRCGVLPDDNADCEMAWTNLRGVARIHRQLWKGICRSGAENIAIGGSKLHPAQKPVALMEFCILRVGDARTILDPYMGSGTTGVACARLGRRFVGIECHEPYFDIACRRIEEAQRQGDLLLDVAPKAPEKQQTDLFGLG